MEGLYTIAYGNFVSKNLRVRLLNFGHVSGNDFIDS